ncbi:MAG TPA: glycogen/starch/alpha-glucan phosphorylase, partial [Bacteroidales bacterium]|nr:glycogen/starch/alpha-glucan phosphorylase [Bacteroidales bacterium]
MATKVKTNNDTDQKAQVVINKVRTGMDVASLKAAVTEILFYQQGRTPSNATLNDVYLSVSYAVRDRIKLRELTNMDAVMQNKDVRIVSYMSAEFLLGPQLGANLIDLDIFDEMKQAVTELGFDFEKVIAQEEEPGLGNGGLGRLAACYIDSMSSLGIPAIGYGIRYEFGIFDQEIVDGWQVEKTDKWLRKGNPWAISRPDLSVNVNFGG